VIEEKAISPPKPPVELVRALGMDQPDWFGSDIIDWLRNIWNELTSLPAKAANLVKDKVDAGSTTSRTGSPGRSPIPSRTGSQGSPID